MFECQKSKLKGCLEIFPKVFKDDRGSFVKVFHKPNFKSLDLEGNFVEEYYSRSFKNVIRGLHFQVPPADHTKLVYCIEGLVFDVVLDLRKDSPTYGQYATFTLDASLANMVYIPKGMAHGFCSISNSSTLVYKTSTIYESDYDKGILWNSLDIPWPTSSPIISERDRSFSEFNFFKSPF